MCLLCVLINAFLAGVGCTFYHIFRQISERIRLEEEARRQAQWSYRLWAIFSTAKNAVLSTWEQMMSVWWTYVLGVIFFIGVIVAVCSCNRRKDRTEGSNLWRWPQRSPAPHPLPQQLRSSWDHTIAEWNQATARILTELEFAYDDKCTRIRSLLGAFANGSNGNMLRELVTRAATTAMNEQCPGRMSLPSYDEEDSRVNMERVWTNVKNTLGMLLVPALNVAPREQLVRALTTTKENWKGRGILLELQRFHALYVQLVELSHDGTPSEYEAVRMLLPLLPDGVLATLANKEEREWTIESVCHTAQGVLKVEALKQEAGMILGARTNMARDLGRKGSGVPRGCFICGSTDHFVARCPFQRRARAENEQRKGTVSVRPVQIQGPGPSARNIDENAAREETNRAAAIPHEPQNGQPPRPPPSSSASSIPDEALNVVPVTGSSTMMAMVSVPTLSVGTDKKQLPGTKIVALEVQHLGNVSFLLDSGAGTNILPLSLLKKRELTHLIDSSRCANLSGFGGDTRSAAGFVKLVLKKGTRKVRLVFHVVPFECIPILGLPALRGLDTRWEMKSDILFIGGEQVFSVTECGGQKNERVLATMGNAKAKVKSPIMKL